MSMRRALIVALLCAATSSADADDERGLVHLGNRVFDFETDVTGVRRDPDFFPLREVGWLDQYFAADPDLANVVMHIQFRDRDLSPWSLTVKDMYRRNTYVGDFPPGFVPDGYEARAEGEKQMLFTFLPQSGEIDHLMNCGWIPSAKAYGFCAVYATYPPDDEIRLLGRVYNPTFPVDPGGIAERLRTIARCLDVTEQEKGSRVISGDREESFQRCVDRAEIS